MYVVQKRHRGDVVWLFWFESSKYDEVLKQLDYYKTVLPNEEFDVYRVTLQKVEKKVEIILLDEDN